ncbi:hypothetical protein ABK040_010377 [Willaertia magna]
MKRAVVSFNKLNKGIGFETSCRRFSTSLLINSVSDNNQKQQTCPYDHNNSTKVNIIDKTPLNNNNKEFQEESTNKLKSFHDLPGPKGAPLIGNVIDLVGASVNPSKYFLNILSEYGPLAKVTAFNKKILLVGDPDLIAHIARQEEGRLNLQSTRFYKEKHNLVLGSIELRHDENWMPVRQLYNVAMRPDFVENIALPQLNDLNSEILQNIFKHVNKDTFELQHGMKFFSRYAFNSVLKTFLGVRLDRQQLPFDIDTFIDQTVFFLNLAVRLDSKPPLYRYITTKDSKEFFATYENVLKCCKKCIEMFGGEQPAGSKPRLRELIVEKAKDMERADEHVVNVLSNFLIGGVDATSRVMSFNMYRLAHHIEYQEKLYQEFEQVFGPPSLDEITSENGLQVTGEQLKKLKLLKNFVEETLRLNGISYASSTRILSKDLDVGGYLIPKDTLVMFMDKYCSWREEYVKQPKDFIPERHEKGSPLGVKNNFVTLPFGIGHRKCPGSRLAVTEIYLLIINTIRHFNISLKNPEKFPEVRDDQSMLYINVDDYPLYLKPRPHASNFQK